MSLRRKDDWDDAMEEASANELKRVAYVNPDSTYNYGAIITIRLEYLIDTDDKKRDKGVNHGPA